MFEDRVHAGRELAEALQKYRDENPLVLAIPRGGVEVGFEVAKGLEADFSLLIVRKLPYPDQPEAGFGAVAEDGSTVILEGAARRIPRARRREIIQEQTREIQRRVDVLRSGKPLPALAGRTVILVDDGIAMGSTMRAAIRLCKDQGPEKLVVAVPVAGQRVQSAIRDLVDELVVLETPQFFRALAQIYVNWHDVTDQQEVLELVDQWEQEH